MSRNSTIPVIPVPPAFVKQYGAQLLSCQINATLYGVGLLMVVQYFVRHGRRDPWLVKGTVGLLCLLATLQTVFTDHQIYANFVLTFGQYSVLNNMVWSVSGKFLFVYLTSFFAQIFFAWCIWIMSRRLSMRYRLLIVPVLLLAAMQISSGIAQVSFMASAHKFSNLNTKKFWNKRVTGMQGAAAAACDIAITVSLILIFRATGPATPVPQRQSDETESISKRIVKYALNRAAVTSVCALLYVVLFYGARGTYYFQIPCFASTHFNVISVTSLLMSRESLRREIDNTLVQTQRNKVTKVECIKTSSVETV